MSPSHPPKEIRVRVPRHHSQRVGPALSAKIVSIAATEGNVKVDTRQSIHNTHEAGSDLVKAIESASEWNSMLASARAERGPQWDVATQMRVFFVDEGSELYYDPTPLRGEPADAAPPKEEPAASSSHLSGFNSVPQAQEFVPMAISPQLRRAPSMSGGMNAAHPYGQPNQNQPFSPISPYGGMNAGMGNMGAMGGMGMNMSGGMGGQMGGMNMGGATQGKVVEMGECP
ncbi:hypothetical protein PUNSTDRAFT_47148 [Punctularia strigosozonata HHB-11173 SS5]|uniref:Uncharacterized protein n=1 Tax=Punctularia strigosozonata (strain HHB-11173) TaxID=741275 RepID=R7S4R0_PUNST|nr:uncharacterized protein PUNSTDRAFT_47148 [Punctularia strigosozonata HHB-11173 SS5]EIN04869.1 hypothetical protein PUNSTDRAFT_47148 [Punctularia strigosozonata HHB-11173 SS5]